MCPLPLRSSQPDREETTEQKSGSAYSSWKKDKRDHGKLEMNNTDAYMVFTGIKNTRANYQKLKYELLAKLKNFGPFQALLLH